MTGEIKRILTGSRQVAAQMDDSLTTADVHELFDAIELGRNWLYKAAELIEQLTTELEQVKRERDAAVWDITNSSPCFACGHFKRNGGVCRGGRTCIMEMLNGEEFGEEYTGLTWQWRGVCAENGGAEDGKEKRTAETHQIP